MIQIAIIGPSASGKTDLAIDIALQTNSIILSLDSLLVYKEIDIVSAKPTITQRQGVVHFGIDEVFPNEPFDVIAFIECYHKAYEWAKSRGHNLIIAGGSGFYLKALLEGLSLGLNVAKSQLDELSHAYELLYEIDPEYMKKIQPNDRYRVSKAYDIYMQTGLTPTQFFKQNRPVPIIESLPIFEVEWEPDTLRKRIRTRTHAMINNGLIDEVICLEKKYSRSPRCMESIGIKETLDYLDSRLTKEELHDAISTHTAQLAKRQRTFNKSQFRQMCIKKPLNELRLEVLKVFLV